MRAVTNYKTSLSSSMTSSQTTMPVASVTTKDGHVLVTGDVDSPIFLVIEPGTDNEELVLATGISGTSWTGLTRGLAYYGNVRTSVADNKKAHQSGSTVIISNVHFYYEDLVDLSSDETITGTKTFTAPNYPRMDDVSTAPVDDEELASKKYVDDTAIAGSPKATDSVYGIAKLSSAAADPAAPVVVNNEEVSAAGGTGAGEDKVVKANASGYIDKDYIELASDPGLEFSTNALTAKIKAAGGLVKDSDGLSVDTGTTDGKIVAMTTGDKLPAVDGSNLTNVAGASYYQKIGIDNAATSNVSYNRKSCAKSDGSVIYYAYYTSGLSQLTLVRLERNAYGYYRKTASVTYNNPDAVSFTTFSIFQLGSYVYLTYNSASKVTRFDEADLANPQVITLSGGSFTGGDSAYVNGSDIYVYNAYSAPNSSYYKYTISGTTMTYVTSINFDATASGATNDFGYDANYVYGSNGSINGVTIVKINPATGATISSTSIYRTALDENIKASGILPLTSSIVGFFDTYQAMTNAGGNVGMVGAISPIVLT